MKTKLSLFSSLLAVLCILGISSCQKTEDEPVQEETANTRAWPTSYRALTSAELTTMNSVYSLISNNVMGGSNLLSNSGIQMNPNNVYYSDYNYIGGSTLFEPSCYFFVNNISASTAYYYWFDVSLAQKMLWKWQYDNMGSTAYNSTAEFPRKLFEDYLLIYLYNGHKDYKYPGCGTQWPFPFDKTSGYGLALKNYVETCTTSNNKPFGKAPTRSDINYIFTTFYPSFKSQYYSSYPTTANAPVTIHLLF